MENTRIMMRTISSFLLISLAIPLMDTYLKKIRVCPFGARVVSLSSLEEALGIA